MVTLIPEIAKLTSKSETRDCDALARFTIAAALAYNDLDVWFTGERIEILTELSDTLYDAVAFYRHRSGGETNSTFAYMLEEL